MIRYQNLARLPVLPKPKSTFHSTPFPSISCFILSSSDWCSRLAFQPFSLDSNADVTAYANEMVQQIESPQTETVLEVAASTETDPDVGFSLNNSAVQSTSATLKTSTPTFFDEITEAPASLSQLESSFIVANTSKTGLPEFFPTSQLNSEATNLPQPQFEDDYTSSGCEFPALPRDDQKVHYHCCLYWTADVPRVEGYERWDPHDVLLDHGEDGCRRHKRKTYHRPFQNGSFISRRGIGYRHQQDGDHRTRVHPGQTMKPMPNPGLKFQLVLGKQRILLSTESQTLRLKWPWSLHPSRKLSSLPSQLGVLLLLALHSPQEQAKWLTSAVKTPRSVNSKCRLGEIKHKVLPNRNARTRKEDPPKEESRCAKNFTPRSDGRACSSLELLTLSITLIWFGAICGRKIS